MDSLVLPPPKLDHPPLPSTFPCFQPLRDALGFCRAALSTGHASYSNLTYPATKTVCDGETKRVYLRGKTHSLPPCSLVLISKRDLSVPSLLHSHPARNGSIYWPRHRLLG